MSGPEVSIEGRRLILACSNNYLGLAGDERVIEAARSAASRFGAGSGASPLVSGLTRAQRDLEERLAAFKGTEDCVIFSSGYLANIGVIQALAGPDDAVFSDELNHASIIDGCRLSRATPVIYRHADMEHLDSLLSEGGFRRSLVVTDSVFSMDGDVAPLTELVEIARRHGAMTVVDEAHATGVLGPAGGGAVEALGLTGQVDAVVGTMSKALGSAGGFVAGTSDLAAWLRNRARSQIFDTAPVPAAIGAASAAIEVIASEPVRRERIAELRALLTEGLRDLGYRVGESESAIIPVFVGESDEAMRLSARIRQSGVFAPAIRPPSVPVGTARIRLTVMATHSDMQIAQVLDAFAAARGDGSAP
ncbi:MAG: 8-amino-7-oxononanoate synthase [Acidobacteria bacterium]|nr:MAG: 8-amino-7-oxononanoate synthase [Acidobacteriota bacterium]